MGRFLLGLILGVLLIPAVVYGWFKYGHTPVAVADAPLPFERQITRIPLHARMESEMVKSAPIQADENNLVAGAEIYRDQCATCHGYHGKPSSFGQYMFPRAPQLWEKHGKGPVVGVSDDPPGETYWRVSNGIRLTGMPSYSKVLSETQMWQVSVLLANADKPLPPAALDILKGGQPATAAAAPAVTAAKAK
jgi:mono/diheme cytochrome c family protein